MKVVLISDLHANRYALDALASVIADADVVLCTGDLIGYYCHANEVVDFIREQQIICVRGNHDHFLFHGCPDSVSEHVTWAIDLANRELSVSNRRYLENLPFLWSGDVGGKRFLLAHGSPWSPIKDYLYENQCDLSQLRKFDVDVVAFGQTHRPWINAEQRPHLINAGSVGQSRHRAGVATAVQLETDTMSTRLIEQSYDTAPLMRDARQQGAGDWIVKHLL